MKPDHKNDMKLVQTSDVPIDIDRKIIMRKGSYETVNIQYTIAVQHASQIIAIK